MADFITSDKIPDTWYKYDWVLTANKPVPSNADYSEENVAPLIKFFAKILGKDPATLKLRYEANTPDNKDDDIIVGWIGISPPCKKFVGKNLAMIKYESYAKKSSILKKFQNNSPANIIYFQPIETCG